MSYFSYVGKLFSNVKGFYNEINAATLTGAIDAIIIQQEDGSYKCSPFHVRFGKLGVLRSREKVVDIEINGESVGLHMKLGDSGEAFFVEEVEEDTEEVPAHLATSPFLYDKDLMKRGLKELREQTAKEESEVKGQEAGHATLQVMDADAARPRVESTSTHPSDPSNSLGAESKLHIENENVEPVKNRKKRRRKKRNNNATASKARQEQQQSTPEEREEDEIFEIEDLSSDEEMSQLTVGMHKSVSLPLSEESKLDRTHEWASVHEGFSYRNPHPFSDTDLSPLASPTSSRPATPKSDTEVDRQKLLRKQESMMEEEETALWDWGEMPRQSLTDDTAIQRSDRGTPQNIMQDDKATSGGLFQFMRKTKNVRHKPEEEGIYLDDLNLQDMDPEVAKLYFPKRFSQSHFKSINEKESDVESGQGPSLPQSPHSVEGAIGGPSCNFLVSEVKHLGNYSLSLCGGLSEPEGMSLDKFMQKIVTFEDLCDNPSMLNNPELVVKIGDKYYNWLTAAPMMLSQMAFHRHLPEKVEQSLVSQHMPKKKEKKGKVTSWFSWRRTVPDDTAVGPSASNSSTAVSSESETATAKSVDTGIVSQSPVASSPSSMNESPQTAKPTEERLKVEEHSSSDSEGTDRGQSSATSSPEKRKNSKEIYRKTLRLTSEQIEKLNLRDGQNEVTYSVTTQFQGTKRCSCHLYLWKHDDKIIVSDIDGTITKSDVLGQILPIMGRDWSQSGVAQLYSSIYGNGYKFLYLSARAIGQAKLTKDLLRNIKQGEQILPEGPLLLSPTSLISAFHREVIEKKPEEFKISCLKDIMSLFPDNCSPFYAGFGNKVNDVFAYKAISIPIFRIFTINTYGELKHELSYTFQSSYTKLIDVADHFFPPRHKVGCRAEFSQVQYWREPLPEISPTDVKMILGDGAKGGEGS